MKLREIDNYFKSLLKISDFNVIDDSLNTVQVGDLNRDIKNVAFAVDASLKVFSLAKSYDLLVVHHGLFWQKRETITSYMFERIKFLIENNLALYAIHLPLDAYSPISHSFLIALSLNLSEIEPFGSYRGVSLGAIGNTNLTFDELVLKLKQLNNNKSLLKTLKFNEKSSKVAIASGGGAFNINEALERGVNTFITGDTAHQIYGRAQEGGVNIIFAGHYFTETFAMKKLKEKVNIELGLETEYFDLNTGL